MAWHHGGGETSKWRRRRASAAVSKRRKGFGSGVDGGVSAALGENHRKIRQPSMALAA